MAETEKGKKIVYAHPYTREEREDGTRVPAHERSTPTTSSGVKRTPRPQPRRTTRRTSR